ncbi:GNAT family N-acetyltransferase [Veronia nyctiphanis]|nr:GNAT family N-acetyltransferase [Veronia nyctiphanis]
MMRVCPMMIDDKQEWAELRNRLWPTSKGPHEQDIEEYLCGDSHDIVTAFGVRDSEDSLVGFIEINVRSHAEGAPNKYVPYIEGWYVSDSKRGQGYGSALIKSAEAWAKERGFSHMASDTELSNEASITLHKKLGFDEVERSVNFIKSL